MKKKGETKNKKQIMYGRLLSCSNWFIYEIMLRIHRNDRPLKEMRVLSRILVEFVCIHMVMCFKCRLKDFHYKSSTRSFQIKSCIIVPAITLYFALFHIPTAGWMFSNHMSSFAIFKYQTEKQKIKKRITLYPFFF